MPKSDNYDSHTAFYKLVARHTALHLALPVKMNEWADCTSLPEMATGREDALKEVNKINTHALIGIGLYFKEK